MKRRLIALAGWLPAVIIPLATLLQCIEVFRADSVEGVSWTTWLLFGIANIGFYIFTEKYTQLQSILGFLGTAVIDFVIVAYVLLHS